MHSIQRHILARLIHRNDARYRDLKPVGMDGNLFSYHLAQLVKVGLVTKTNDRYHLSPSGTQYSDTLSLTTLEPRAQPKIVTMVVCRNNEGAWLLYRRSRQPFRNLIGFPYGKIHLGETIVAAAARELVEKTGIEASLSHAGDAYLTVSQDDDVVSQMLAHIFVGEKPRGTLKETSEIGTCFWADLATFASADLMPGVHDIITLLSQSRDHFFRELSYRL